MRTLLVSNLFPPDVLGGYELLADDVARALRGRGHDVHVLSTGAPRGEDPSWVHRSLSLIRPFGEPPARDRLRHALAAPRHRRVVEELLAREGPFDAALFLSQRRLGLHVARALQATKMQSRSFNSCARCVSDQIAIRLLRCRSGGSHA